MIAWTDITLTTSVRPGMVVMINDDVSVYLFVYLSDKNVSQLIFPAMGFNLVGNNTESLVSFRGPVRRRARQVGSMVSMSDSGPGGCEFHTWLRKIFFPAYFRFSPLLKHVEKVVGGFGRKFR